MKSLLGFLVIMGAGLVGCGGPTMPDTTIREKISPRHSVRDGGSGFEKKLASLMRGHSGQRRSAFVYDARLNRVARAKARDMARRRYFNHVDPDGYGPNYHVRKAGYPLPNAWGNFKKENYVESILSGPTTPEEAMASFINSRVHRKHILGTDSFYRKTPRYGIGYYFDASSPFRHYWVFISAPEPGAGN